MNTVTLDTNPSDAPCCMKLISSDGRDCLIQTDWDWPGLAMSFGWNPKSVQRNSDQYGNYPCDHNGTDGTIDCPECGLTAMSFISAAGQYLDSCDGDEIEDPGYFD